jgi:tRNA-dihydrouridine synthase A
MLLAASDRVLFESRAGAASAATDSRRAAALRDYCRHVGAELRAGTPLKAMTRHLLGIYAGERGGRKWRRALGELPNGTAGLDALRALIRANTDAGRARAAELAPFAAPAFQTI